MAGKYFFVCSLLKNMEKCLFFPGGFNRIGVFKIKEKL